MKMDGMNASRNIHLLCLLLGAVFLGKQAGAQPEPQVTINGIVIDDRTGHPVGEFRVTGTSGLEIGYDSSAPGTFKTSRARSKWPYQFRVEAPGYAPFQSERFMTPVDGTSITKTFRLGPGGSVIGRVVHADNGTPLAGVHIRSIDSQLEDGCQRSYPTCVTGKTDGTGEFRLDRVGAGEQLFEFTPPAGSGLVSASFRTDVVHGEVTDMDNLKLGSGSIIDGLLVSTPGDKPLAGELVATTGYTTTTDADGRFRFTGMRNGIYKVTVSSRAFESWVAVEAQETKSVTLRISSVPVVVRFLCGNKAVKSSGRLVRAGPNQSIIRYWNSDEHGTVRLENLSPGPWQLEGSCDENRSLRVHRVVEVPDSGSELDLLLRYPAGKLHVAVAGPDGRPMAGVTTRLRSPATTCTELVGAATDMMTDEQGIARFDYLEAGRYTVCAFASATMRSDRAEVAVSDTEPAEARLVPKASSGGAVRSETLSYGSGKPLKSAWCYLFLPDGTLWEHPGVRGDDGIMQIDGIPPGRYEIQVSASGNSVSMHSVDIRSNETVALTDVLYQAGALRWTLLNEGGRPVPDAICTLTPLNSDTVEVVRRGVTNNQGIFIARGLFPGQYEVVGTDSPRGKTVTQTLTISPANLTQESATLR